MLRWYFLWPCVFCAGLSGCSKSESDKYPEAYGVYAQLGRDWVELRDPLTTIGIDVPPDIKFLVHDKLLSLQTDGGFKLSREVFVRNLISQDPSGGDRKEKPENAWQLSGGDPIATHVLPVDGKPEIVIIRPRTPLPQGVYHLSALGQTRESISVGAPGVFRSPDRDEHCVDIVRTLGFGFLPMGIPDRTVPCVAIPAVQAPQVDPSSQAGGLVPPPLSTKWYGTWQTQDRKKTIEISATTMKVRVDMGSEPQNRYELTLASNSGVGAGQFGDARRSTSPAEVSKKYEEALTQFRNDPKDFSVSDSTSSHAAIASLHPGKYAVVQGYLGGDCAIWDWILDKNGLLEVSQCKYGFHVQLLRRVEEL